jgi:hypothetical protein
MTDIEEAVKDRNYDAAATAASKATIFVFIGTFLYMVFTSGISPGFIGGTIFFIVGIFVVSLAISMPLMLVRIKLPKLSGLVSIADVVITIFATRWVYIWLFAT